MSLVEIQKDENQGEEEDKDSVKQKSKGSHGNSIEEDGTLDMEEISDPKYHGGMSG